MSTYRKHIIVVINNETVETWGNLKKVCQAYNWGYHSLVRKEFPIDYRGHKIYKCEYK